MFCLLACKSMLCGFVSSAKISFAFVRVNSISAKIKTMKWNMLRLQLEWKFETENWPVSALS